MVNIVIIKCTSLHCSIGICSGDRIKCMQLLVHLQYWSFSVPCYDPKTCVLLTTVLFYRKLDKFYLTLYFDSPTNSFYSPEPVPICRIGTVGSSWIEKKQRNDCVWSSPGPRNWCYLHQIQSCSTENWTGFTLNIFFTHLKIVFPAKRWFLYV